VSEHETEQDEVQQDDSDDAGEQGDDDRQGTPGEDDAPEHGSGGGAV
jgi:hypothetical protein